MALGACAAAFPALAFAAATLPDANLTLSSVIRLINTIANWIFAIFLAVAVMYILYAAYLYLTGEEQGIEESKKRLIAAAIAIAIALLAKGVGILVARLLVEGGAIERGVPEQLFDASGGTGGTSGSGGGAPGFQAPIRGIDFPIPPPGPRPA